MLVLDDLHWANPASLDLLRSLARELASLPLLLLALPDRGYSPGRAPLFPVLPALVREAAAARLDPRVLDDDAIHAWLRAHYRLADPHAARLLTYLQARAEGNPFFTGEVLRTLEETGLLRAADEGVWTLGDLATAGIPPLLRQVLVGAGGAAGRVAHELLTVAAVIGQAVPLALWATVGAVAEGALLDVVERAVGAPAGGGRRWRKRALHPRPGPRDPLRGPAAAAPTRVARPRRRGAAGVMRARSPVPDPDAVAPTSARRATRARWRG